MGQGLRLQFVHCHKDYPASRKSRRYQKMYSRFPLPAESGGQPRFSQQERRTHEKNPCSPSPAQIPLIRLFLKFFSALLYYRVLQSEYLRDIYPQPLYCMSIRLISARRANPARPVQTHQNGTGARQTKCPPLPFRRANSRCFQARSLAKCRTAQYFCL